MTDIQDNSLRIANLIGRVTSSLSILGSSLIIYMIMSDRKRKLDRPFHRIVLMMSFFDVLQSSAMVIGNAAFPKETNIYGAKGNEYTCGIQGFVMVLALAVPLYNACLNIFYVLTIRYSFSSERFTKFEPALHAIAILVPFSMAITFISRGDMYPQESVCVPSMKSYVFSIASLFVICFLICIISMVCICWTVISQANKMECYTTFGKKTNSPPIRSRINDEKKETIMQALLYASAFIFTYFFVIIGVLVARFNGRDHTPSALIILSYIFYPLQGFWNFVFYVRPGVKNVKKASPTKSYFEALRNVVFNPMSTTNTNNPRRRQSLVMGRLPTTLRSNNSVKSGDVSGALNTSNQAGYPCFEENVQERLQELSNSSDTSEEMKLELSCTGLNQQESNIDGLNIETCLTEEDFEAPSDIQLQSGSKPRRLFDSNDS